ncbi:MAG: TRAP transporter large permease subunit, partial [Marivita sp.]
NTFSLMITSWAGGNILIALILIALASLVLGMGLPVTAAYIVLATLSAPALSGMISDQFVISQLAAGSLPEAAKAVLMFGVPDQIELLSRELTRAEAAGLIQSLPLEIAAPVRDLVVPPAIATSALLSAHMIIFWLSQDSNVTPPVALAAFTAAAIAKAPAMATGVASWKLAKGLYIIPVLFAYTPFLSGDWPAMIQVFCFGAIGVYALAGALQGCMEKPFGYAMRALCLVAGIAALWPGVLIVNIVGAVATVVILMANIRFGKTPPVTAVPDAA